uniref:Ribonuclease A-domain domain-containing protein n=2 Tax=Paramormyrops kingsleyae TaxID=1676925 RepID=A0A3B3RCM0_9TELE
MRTQFTSESSMDAAHKLFEKLLYWLKSQEQCAAELDQIAKDLDEIRSNVNVAKVVGCSIATAASVGGLIATFCTGGLAAPLLVASVAGSAGTVTTLIASYIEELKSSDHFKKKQMILEKAEEATSEMKASLEEMVKEIGRTGVTLEELEEMLMGRNTSNLSVDKLVVLYHFLGALAHRNHSALRFACKQESLWILRAFAESKSEMLHPLFNFLESINGEIHVPLQRKTGIDVKRLIKNICLNAIQRNVRKEGSKMLKFGIIKLSARTTVKNNLIKQGSKALTREVTKTAARTAAKISCGIGLAISLVELVDVSLDLAKNEPTEASTQLRETAKTIGENVWEIRSMLNSFRKIIEDLEMKRKKEAEEKRKREAEEKRKREAEEKRKREAEEKRKREAEEKRPKTRTCQENAGAAMQGRKVLLLSFIILVVCWISKSQLMLGNQETQQSQLEKEVMDILSTTNQGNKKSKTQDTRKPRDQPNLQLNSQIISEIERYQNFLRQHHTQDKGNIYNKLMNERNQETQQSQLEKEVMDILSTTNQGNKKSKTQDTRKSCDQPNLQLNSQIISEIIERYQKFLRQHHARDKGNICNKLMNERKIINEKQNKCKVINTFIITDSKNSITDVCDKGGEDYCKNGKKFQKSIKRFQVVTCTVKNENAAYPYCDYRQQESSRYIVVACENGLPVHYENGLL